MGQSFSQSYNTEDVEARIKEFRNNFFIKRRFIDSVLFTHMFSPILSHGSHFIYAPDDALTSVIAAVCNRISKTPTEISKTRSGSDQDSNKNERSCTGEIKEWLWTNKIFCCFLLFCGIAFKLKGDEVKCGIQNASIGWANKNREMTDWYMRFLSITLMMIVRLFVSNILPFTSAAFAYLIAKSQSPGPYEGLMGVLYLLGCSAAAGAVVPVLDEFLSLFPPYKHKEAYRKLKQEARMEYSDTDPNSLDGFFRATRFLSWMTDQLPFSFWVRKALMQPAWYLTRSGTDASPEHAGAAALLAGHFMIWAGPATTMNQRLFLPDWVTCILIQPLGLMEDVAVVLATWAGESGSNTLDAELALLVFMLMANVFRYISTPAPDDKCDRWKRTVQHIIVAMCTIVVAGLTYIQLQNTVASTVTSITTPIVAMNGNCQTTHSDTKAMAMVIAKVSGVAVFARVIAILVTCDCSKTWCNDCPTKHSIGKRTAMVFGKVTGKEVFNQAVDGVRVVKKFRAREIAPDDLRVPILQDAV